MIKLKLNRAIRTDNELQLIRRMQVEEPKLRGKKNVAVENTISKH